MDRSTQQVPGYRPPLAVGQVYPPLGYSDAGAPLFTYDDRERVLAGPPPVVEPPPPPAPPPPAPEPDGRWNLAIGLAATVVLVLIVAVGFKWLGGGTDDAPTNRADPPATQSTDDPYLKELPKQPQSSVPRDPEADDQPGRSGTATVVYEVESGPATILYFAGDRVQIARNESGTWKQTIRGSQSKLLRVSVILSSDEPATCTITVDGKTVVTQSTGASSTTGMLTCQFRG
ncbi:hypothetical protein [Gordonia phthalatica]|uniref:Uncharacterized protein n=1 Tax=Gordonia phthalatica TaxID=1136941 RepID=A0A0N9N8A6_9ACTN|nr:hypothetical protein [Gordonia phthalatica]ALG83438.1 hypothetical protein ACH46_01575 [Gordonia phthalatica]